MNALPRSGSDPAEVLVRDPLAASLSLLARDESHLGVCFLSHLFALAPALRQRFPLNPEGHGLRLLRTLRALTEARVEPSVFSALCAELADRHAGYGIEERDFDAVGAALLVCLRELLGERFDESTEEAWATLYGEASEAMIAHARAASELGGGRASGVQLRVPA